MTLEESSGTVKTAKKVIIKGDTSFDTLFSRQLEKFKVFWASKEVGYLLEPNGVKDDVIKGIRDAQNCQDSM